jgi:hypothetical protein
LFNNIGYQPALVSMDGTATGSGIRTPQLRYTHQINEVITWNLALEYSQPTFIQPDTTLAELLQLMPDLTGRFSFSKENVSFRIAIISNVITGRRANGNIEYEPIFGASFATRVSLWKDAIGYFSISGGKGMARFIDMFGGKKADFIYNPITDNYEGLGVLGSYIAIGQELPKNLSLSAGAGFAFSENKDYQRNTDFKRTYDLLLNLFWNPVPGARFGLEYAYGKRFNKDDTFGAASRVSALIVYDF